MKKNLFGLFLILAAASSAFAQRTIVSGSVIDPNGIPYTGGTLVATLTLPVGASGAILNGQQITGATQRLTLDGTGSFLMQLPDNNQVQCTNAIGQIIACVPPTQWIISINISPGQAPPFGTGPQTFSQTFTITGASQTLAFSGVPALTRVSTTTITGTVNAVSAGSPKYGVKNNLRFAGDASTTNALPTITSATIGFQCPGNSFPCVNGGDVGSSVYTVNPTTHTSAIVGVVGTDATIVSVQSPTQATASVNATATETNDTIVVAANDTAGLVSAWNDAIALNSTLLLPCPTTNPSAQTNSGGMLVTSHLFDLNNAPDTFPLSATFLVQGCAGSSVMLVPAPNFNFATCVIGCVYGIATQNVRVNPGGLAKLTRISDFSIQGFASNFLGNVTIVPWVRAPYRTERVQILGMGGGAGSGGTGQFRMNEAEDFTDALNIQFNSTAFPSVVATNCGVCIMNNTIIAFNGGDAIDVGAGTDKMIINNGLINNRVVLQNGSTNTSIRGSSFTTPTNSQGVQVASGATAVLDDDEFLTSNGTTAIGLQVLAGGTVHLKSFQQTTTGAGNASLNNAGTLFDEGGNNPGSTFTNSGSVFGSSSVAGTACTTGNWALTSGWGTSTIASVTAGGDSHRCQVVITGAAGAAGPVLTWTFPTSYFVAPGSCQISFNGTLTGESTGAPSTTSVAFTFTGTPSAQTYRLDASCGP